MNTGINNDNPMCDLMVVTSDNVASSSPEPGLQRLIGAYNRKLFLAEHRMEKGWTGAAHSHPHEQIVYVISGHLKLSCAGKTFELRSGDSFVVRGGVEHQATALEPTHVIDVFTPWRKEYL
jgi:quercetin dioxygenase-like cupin family protein